MRTPDDTEHGKLERHPLGPLMLECVELLFSEGWDGVERILHVHPEHADAIRARLRLLDELELLDEGAGPGVQRFASPRQVGEFRILERLGVGGMGIVYLAEQESLHRQVALKVLPPGLLDSEAARERFRREAHTIAALDHPHIVRVISAGEDGELPWIAMEYVPGRGLDEILCSRARHGENVPFATLLRWGRDVARALASAHAAGVVHRDVKPANVRVDPAGEAKLLDFGLARLFEGDDLTMTRAFQGSPHYAAPEQVRARGEPIGPAADVYGLGVTLFECFTGRVPFDGETTEQVFHAILGRDPPFPRRLDPSVPRDVQTVILTAIEKEPEDRYANAAELADDLDAVLAFRPIRARSANPLTRARKWGRRHRVRATLGAITLLAVAAIPVTLLVGAQQRASVRREAARSAMHDAREGVIELRTLRALLTAKLERRDELGGAIQGRGPGRDSEGVFAEFHAVRVAIDQAIHESNVLENRVRESIVRASRLDPSVAEPRRLEASLFLELYRLSSEIERRHSPFDLDWMRNGVHSRFYQELVEAKDLEGRYAKELHPVYRVDLRSYPWDAEVYLFEYRSHRAVVDGGEERRVPVPWGECTGDLPLQPGTPGLRVVEPVPGLHRGDFVFELAGHLVGGTVLLASGDAPARRFDRLVAVDGIEVADRLDVDGALRAATATGEHVFSIERAGGSYELRGSDLSALGIELSSPWSAAERGGIAARIWRHGAIVDLTGPPGARFRPTAAPLLMGPACRVGRTPLELELERGSYLLVLRREGCRDQRFPLYIPQSLRSCPMAIRLDPQDRVPRGFVRVQALFAGPLTPFWIMDHEVTCDQYLEFLNDSATLAEIGAAPAPIRFPRAPDSPVGSGLWKRTESGFSLPSEWDVNWPVVGVSWHDAMAYAAWKSRRAAALGEPIRYTLPTWSEWFVATGRDDPAVYPWGNYFSPAWTNSCFSRWRVGPEPVCSYPVDENPRGLFDTAGSAFEWVDHWFSEERGERLRVGGAWEHSQPEYFRPDMWTGAKPHFAAQSQGFRLVARELVPVDGR